MRSLKLNPILLTTLAVLLAFSAFPLLADIDEGEVLRLGDMVQHVDGRCYGQTSEDVAIEALKPPADDTHKWFISVITTPRCAGCLELKKAWATDPWLLALADPEDSKASWAHFGIYDHTDKTQTERWKNLKITGYPTIVVQPPKNGDYGPPADVVYQSVYCGDPQRQAAEIGEAIKLRATSLAAGHSQRAPPWQPPSREVDPQRLLPWDPPAERDRRLIPPLVPDEVDIEVAFPWQAALSLLAGGFSITAIVALAIWLLVTIRGWRKESGQKLLLSDPVFNRLIKLLERLDGQPDAPKTPDPKTDA